MNLKLVVRPLAQEDLVEARDWYEQLGRDLEIAFCMPWKRFSLASKGGLNRRLRNIELKVQRFPYVVCYRITANEIEVIAIVHGSRRSRAWRRRA